MTALEYRLLKYALVECGGGGGGRCGGGSDAFKNNEFDLDTVFFFLINLTQGE